MTTQQRFERDLPALLEDLYLGPTPDYRHEVLAVAVRSRQRPSWTFPGRWLPMDTTTRRLSVIRLPWRQIAILAVLAVLLAATFAVYIGSQRPVPAPFGPARNGVIPYISDGNVFVGDPVSGTTRLIVSSPRGAGASSPGFSPDGTRLAFVRDVPTDSTNSQSPVDIYVARADGTEQTKITSAPISTLVWATWAPDGRSLAVIHPVDGANRLEFLDIRGDQPPRVLEAAANADQMAFRPPLGQEILFRALEDGKYGLYVMNADGTNKRTLIRPTETAEVDVELDGAIYSADGSRIFYQRWTPDSIQLWVMNADSTDRHEFHPEPGAGWDGLPAPSPDGKWVAYWHVIQDGRSFQRVSVVSADGTGPVIPTGPDLVGNARFTWSPDSTRILMIPDDGSSDFAYLLHPAGGPWTTVPWQSDPDLDWQRLAS